jgi:N-acetylglutamate synthase-like GNAT family acetyltransferase
MVVQKSTPKGYLISTDKRRFNVALIHRFLRSTYWAKDIPRNVVAKSIRNSLCFGVYYRGQQVGFARVITDRATVGYLADVFIVPEHRGRGVGRMLIARILANRNLQGLRRILLATHDAQDFYASLGFKPLAHPEHFMTIHRPNAYQAKGRLSP